MGESVVAYRPTAGEIDGLARTFAQPLGYTCHHRDRCRGSGRGGPAAPGATPCPRTSTASPPPPCPGRCSGVDAEAPTRGWWRHASLGAAVSRRDLALAGQGRTASSRSPSRSGRVAAWTCLVLRPPGGPAEKAGPCAAPRAASRPGRQDRVPPRRRDHGSATRSGQQRRPERGCAGSTKRLGFVPVESEILLQKQHRGPAGGAASPRFRPGHPLAPPEHQVRRPGLPDDLAPQDHLARAVGGERSRSSSQPPCSARSVSSRVTTLRDRSRGRVSRSNSYSSPGPSARRRVPAADGARDMTTSWHGAQAPRGILGTRSRRRRPARRRSPAAARTPRRSASRAAAPRSGRPRSARSPPGGRGPRPAPPRSATS